MKELSDAEVMQAGELSDADVMKAPSDSLSGTATVNRPHSLYGDVSELVGNIPGSAKKFGHDIIQPVIHPVDTAEAIGKTGLGVLQKTGFKEGDEYKKYPEAIGAFFKDRYGSVDNALKTLREDPVGAAADLATVLTGGEAAIARAPGMIGKVGEIAGAAGRAVDPLSTISKSLGAVAAPVGDFAAKTIGGLGTHTGSETVEKAFTSGVEGGSKGKDFRENMRSTAPTETAVEEARSAVSQMRKERGKAYRSGMADLSKDKTILSYNDIDAALADIEHVASFKGQSLSPSTANIREAIKSTITDWKNLKASEFWTPEGFDALKKKIGDLRDATQFGTPERVVADQAYQAIRKTIIKQAPEYAKIMKGYEEASAILRDIEKTLSLNKNASIDTALRKLQSVLRDNVNTSYGYRRELINYLVNAGAPNLLEKLAGQAMQSWTPRGLGRLQAGSEAGGAAIAALLGHPGALLASLPVLAASSPRIVGEVAHAAGRASPTIKAGARPVAQASYQAGRQPFDYNAIGAKQGKDGKYYVKGKNGQAYRVEVGQ